MSRSEPAAHGESQDESVRRRLKDLDVDLESLAVAVNVTRAASLIRNQLERAVLAEVGLTWTAYVTLWLLWVAGVVETGLLAVDVGVTKPTLTGVLNRLEARGLVRRRPHRTDGRRVLVQITRKGATLMTRIFPLVNEEEVRVSRSLGPKQKAELVRLLRTMAVDLGDRWVMAAAPDVR